MTDAHLPWYRLPMEFTDEEIARWREIWKEEFNEEITEAYARQRATEVMQLYLVLYGRDPDDPSKPLAHNAPDDQV